MKRKLLALFLVLSMCVGIFAGCSNGGSGSSSSSAGGGDSSTADTSSEAGSEASTGDTAGKQTDGKNLPELTTEPLDILGLGHLLPKSPARAMSEGAVARLYGRLSQHQCLSLCNQQNDNYKQQLDRGNELRPVPRYVSCTGAAAPWPSITSPALSTTSPRCTIHTTIPPSSRLPLPSPPMRTRFWPSPFGGLVRLRYLLQQDHL